MTVTQHPIGYSEHCQTFKLELSAKIAKHSQLLTIFEKSSILVVWLGSEFQIGVCMAYAALIIQSYTVRLKS